LHGKDALTQEDVGVNDEGDNQQSESTMGKVKGALGLGK